MNTKEYISSGIIESCVLGMATEPECRELDQLCIQYPEILAARNAFEISLEEEALRDAPPAPAGGKEIFLAAISNPGKVEVMREEAPREEAKVFPMWKWVAAASLILFAASSYWALSLNNQKSDLVKENFRLRSSYDSASTALQSFKTDASILREPSIRTASLTSGSTAYATIYWDTTSTDVYLLLSNLPKAASDKQYQLWALLNGQPIDLGMIEAREERLLYRMKNVRDAQAFAITLEPKGGSPAPTSTPIAVTNL